MELGKEINLRWLLPSAYKILILRKVIVMEKIETIVIRIFGQYLAAKLECPSTSWNPGNKRLKRSIHMVVHDLAFRSSNRADDTFPQQIRDLTVI